MYYICLGGYATEQEALDAKAARHEPQDELSVAENGAAYLDPDHPWRVWWARPQ